MVKICGRMLVMQEFISFLHRIQGCPRFQQGTLSLDYAGKSPSEPKKNKKNPKWLMGFKLLNFDLHP